MAIHSISIRNSIGTVSSGFDIIYRITSTDLSEIKTVRFYYEEIKPSTLIGLSFSPTTDIDQICHITVADLQNTNSMGNYPTDGEHTIYAALLDYEGEILATANTTFIWMNTTAEAVSTLPDDTIRVDLGEVTAYAAAVRGGYTGSVEEFNTSLAIAADIRGGVFYGTCDTAAGTAMKTVTSLSQTFELIIGVEIYVKFTNTNTASNPTIKVNNTAAKSIWYNTGVITTSNLNRAGYAGRYEKYIYDGVYWVWAGWSIDSDTTYSNMSIAEFQAGTATNSRSVTAKNLKAAVNSYDTAFGICESATNDQVKVATINDSNWQLRTGGIVGVKFTYTNSYSATAENTVKLNVNNTGDITIFGGGAVPTGTSTTYFGSANYVNYYMYDGTYWVWMGHSTDSNTTYTNASLGQGYGTCSTKESTTAKTVTLSSYKLVTGGVVSVKFTNAVPANATMSINSQTSKPIYYRGSAITSGIIKAGYTATFIYNGSQYVLISIDEVNINEGGALQRKDIAVSATASSGTVGEMDYEYKQEVTWGGMTTDDLVSAYFVSGTYDDEITVSSAADKCVVYFADEPTELVTLRLIRNVSRNIE